MRTISDETFLSIINIDYAQLNRKSTPKQEINDLFASLPEKGLDRFTDAKIEYIICTSALAAFF